MIIIITIVMVIVIVIIIIIIIIIMICMMIIIIIIICFSCCGVGTASTLFYPDGTPIRRSNRARGHHLCKKWLCCSAR